MSVQNYRGDVLVHISAVERAGLSSLNEGAKNPPKPQAWLIVEDRCRPAG